MKGMVFTELIEMVEEVFGFEVAAELFEGVHLPSGGAYTAVGTYEFAEMGILLNRLSELTQTSIPDLLQAYGKHLFGRFAKLYPNYVDPNDNAFSFLKKIENYIHVEVYKLYPEAELPKFEIRDIDEHHFEMIYNSPRGLADFAEGLIKGCITYFEEDIVLEREDLKTDKTQTRFLLGRE